jgi:hypothetical protein
MISIVSYVVLGLAFLIVVGGLLYYKGYYAGHEQGKKDAIADPFVSRVNKDARSAAASPKFLWLGDLYAFTSAQVQVARKRAIENQSDLSE